MATQARAELATASINAVGDQDRVDGSTSSEAAINVVTEDEGTKRMTAAPLILQLSAVRRVRFLSTADVTR
jgi:hypothetical protein